jgi:phosphatidylserine/phosphatidylglycerophosphate/cardiolipin synthase-like enzyme
MLRPFPVHPEVWSFDRKAAITANERVVSAPPTGIASAFRADCLLGEESANGLASYFEQRWQLEGRSLAFSVQQRDFKFQGGLRADLSFFSCLLGAQDEIVISLPGSRVSRMVANALQEALRQGIHVQLFTNADRDEAPGLRRLRRLAAEGAVLKICGRRLRSEFVIIDGQAVYLGSLPSAWHRWTRSSSLSFVVNDSETAGDLLGALEAQVSVEVSGPTRATPV